MQVYSNPDTSYRVRVGFGRDYREFYLDDPVLGVLDYGVLAPSPASYTYSDITADVTGIDIERGRRRSTDQPQADRATVRLLDRTRAYDPENTSSPYYGNLQPGRPVIIDAKASGGAWRPLYTGKIAAEGIGYTMMPGGYQLCELRLTTSWSDLANQALTAAASFAAEPSGTRFANLIALCYPAPAVAYDPGDITVQARTETAGTGIIELLARLDAAESGALYVAADGTLTFRSRYSTLNVPANVELTPTTSRVQYAALDVQHGDEVYPLVQVTDASGAVATAQNSSARAAYPGQLDISPTGLLASADAQALADMLLSRYQQPVTNVRSATVEVTKAAITPGRIDALLGLELRDAVKLTRTFTVGAPAQIDAYYVVEHLTHRIDRARHELLVGFGARSSDGWFTLDSAAFGVLDSPALLV